MRRVQHPQTHTFPAPDISRHSGREVNDLPCSQISGGFHQRAGIPQTQRSGELHLRCTQGIELNGPRIAQRRHERARIRRHTARRHKATAGNHRPWRARTVPIQRDACAGALRAALQRDPIHTQPGHPGHERRAITPSRQTAAAPASSLLRSQPANNSPAHTRTPAAEATATHSGSAASAAAGESGHVRAFISQVKKQISAARPGRNPSMATLSFAELWKPLRPANPGANASEQPASQAQSQSPAAPARRAHRPKIGRKSRRAWRQVEKRNQAAAASAVSSVVSFASLPSSSRT